MRTKKIEVRVVLDGQVATLHPFDALGLILDGIAVLPEDLSKDERLYLACAKLAHDHGRVPPKLTGARA